MSKSSASYQAPRRAFSYIRFSTKKQMVGDSYRRQTEASLKWCERKKIPLDPANFEDLGVSGFRGKNVTDGALAGFVEACKMGRVPHGSYLIIENLDRLSRDDIRPCLSLFFQILDAGITIVTLEPEREYAPDNKDPLSLIEPLIIFSRAHEESEMKAKRIGATWETHRNKAQAGSDHVLRCRPAWLAINRNRTDKNDCGTYTVVQPAAEAVALIFRLALEGMGAYRIAVHLKDNAVPPIGKKTAWNRAYVSKILTNPATIGTHQPCKLEADGRRVPVGSPIENYYPAIIDRADFDRVQAIIRTRNLRGSPGRASADKNLFTKLLHSAYFKSRYVIGNSIHTPANGVKKTYLYLTPQTNGAPAASQSFDYTAFELAMLSYLIELTPTDIVPAKGQVKKTHRVQTDLSARMVDIDNRITILKERAKKGSDMIHHLDMIDELQSERKQLVDQLNVIKEEQRLDELADLGATQETIRVYDQAPEADKPSLRRRMKARIRALIDSVWMLVEGGGRGQTAKTAHVQIFFRNGERGYLVIHHPRPRTPFDHHLRDVDMRTWTPNGVD